ncbi:glycosyltransferase family 39 protein [Leptolyngbya ohadii]|uniref:glycosyltransferase family 39 protein n=1 Tax=Leptolyngbya ohadii TaxID=1962290 RepID=UPI000B59CC2E|nr:glycosyltransferase family 39 protein [Leptolyngbya ohadii]
MKEISSASPERDRNWLQSVSQLLAHQEAIVALFILCHLAITIPLAAVLNIWFDEGYSLNTTSRDVVFAVQHGLNYEWQPPVFPALLNLWRSLNGSIFFARLFSVLCSTLTIYVGFLLSKRFIHNIHPAWIAGILAFNPYLIWAGVEIRLYALSILFSALLLLFFYDGYLADNGSSRARWIYFFLSILGLYTHFFLAFVLIANGAALLFLRRWRALSTYIVFTAIAGLCFLPFFLLLVARLSDRLEAYNDPVPLTRSLSFVVLSITNFIVYIWKDSSFSSRVFRAFWGLAIPLVCLFLIAKSRRTVQAQHQALWIGTLVIGLLLAAFLTKTSTATEERYVYPLLVPSILGFLCVLSLIQSGAVRRSGLRIWAGVIACFFTVSLFTIYSPLAKTGDWHRVASYLTATEQSNQPILVFSAELEMMLKPYYSGKNAIVPVPQKQQFEQFNPADFQIKNEQQVFDFFSQIPADQQTVWLVTSEQHCPGLGTVKLRQYPDSLNCGVLTDFVNKNYSVVSVQQFFESTVQLLKRNPAPLKP